MAEPAKQEICLMPPKLGKGYSVEDLIELLLTDPKPIYIHIKYEYGGHRPAVQSGAFFLEDDDFYENVCKWADRDSKTIKKTCTEKEQRKWLKKNIPESLPQDQAIVVVYDQADPDKKVRFISDSHYYFAVEL